jgi:hypothetical protein
MQFASSAQDQTVVPVDGEPSCYAPFFGYVFLLFFYHLLTFGIVLSHAQASHHSYSLGRH